MSWKIATGATGATLMLLAAHGLRAQTPADPPAPPAGAGLDLINERCTSCHTAGMIFAQRKSRADWATTVQAMADRGADVSTDDMAAITDYLARNFPAPADKAPARPGGPG